MSLLGSFPMGSLYWGLIATKQLELARGITESAAALKPWKMQTPQERSLVFQHTPGTKHLGVEM